MASFSTVMDRLRMVSQAESLRALAIIIEEYPEILFSKQGVAYLMERIPRLVRTNHETTINFELVDQIITAHRCREIGGFKPTVMNNVADMPGGFANNDYALHVLKIYIYNLVEVTKGECLSWLNIKDAYPQGKGHFDMHPYAYLGWLLLLPDYEHYQTDILWKALETYYFGSMSLTEFVRQIINVSMPTISPVEVADIVGAIWCQNRVDHTQSRPMDASRDRQADFMAQCTSENIAWLDEKIREDKTILDGHPAPEFIIADCNEAFIMLHKIFTNPFTKENFFFEYLSEIAVYYPLIRQRLDTATRYERYFGEDSLIYMADMTNEIIRGFSSLSDYTTEAAHKVISNQIHRKAEAIILDMHRKYPDVDPRVINLFFDDTCACFGRGFNGAAPGAMLKIEPMIYEIFKRDETAVESDFDYLDFMVAMEAGGNSYDNMSLHRKAKPKVNAKQALKGGERKIYSAYHKYKEGEEQVDQVLKNGIGSLKKAVTGDQHKMIIEGKEFSPIGFLKKVLGTVAIFNYNKVAGILGIIVGHTLRKKANRAEKRKVLMELEAELEMVNEKINDASSDGNRQAKYDLMRTRAALQNAISRIKYGMGAEQRSGVEDAKRLQAERRDDRDDHEYRGSTQDYKTRKYRG